MQQPGMKRCTDEFMVLVKTAGWRYNQHSKQNMMRNIGAAGSLKSALHLLSSDFFQYTLIHCNRYAAGFFPCKYLFCRNNSLIHLILLEVSLVLLACVKFPPVVAPSSDAAEAPRKLATILRQPSCLSAVLTMASSYRSWDSTLERYTVYVQNGLE